MLVILPSRICSWAEHPKKHSACIEPNGLLSCVCGKVTEGDWAAQVAYIKAWENSSM